MTDDLTRHSAATAGPPVTLRDGFIALQKEFLRSFPDQHVTLQHIVAEGDYVAALATYTGRGASSAISMCWSTGRSFSRLLYAL